MSLIIKIFACSTNVDSFSSKEKTKPKASKVSEKVLKEPERTKGLSVDTERKAKLEAFKDALKKADEMHNEELRQNPGRMGTYWIQYI